MSSKKVSFEFFFNLGSFAPCKQCLKITEKVSFGNVYILSGQKLIKNAKNGQFCEFLIDENAKIKKLRWDKLSDFQTMCGLKKVSI